MSLMSAISSATSGLIATQAVIDVASRNIANASVEGYTRKVQTTSTRVIDGQAGAVKVEEVTRNVNEQLQRDVREQSAVVEELKVIRSEEHTSEIKSLMRTSYADFCLNKKTTTNT